VKNEGCFPKGGEESLEWKMWLLDPYAFAWELAHSHLPVLMQESLAVSSFTVKRREMRRQLISGIFWTSEFGEEQDIHHSV
jgi:hypothetical protein